jgi:hypothetical protein
MARLPLLEEFLNREFGELDINLRDPSEMADDIAANAPKISAAPGLGTGAPDEIAMPSFGDTRPDPDNFIGEDTARLFGAGVLDIAEGAVGIPEYIARQNTLISDSVPKALESVRGGISEIREGILEGVSPEYLDHVGREMLTLDPEKTMWKGNPLEIGGAIWGKFTRALPGTLSIMLPAAAMFRAANTAGALTYLGASEGGLSVGAIQNNLADEVNAMELETLLEESPRFAELYAASGNNEDAARTELIREAQGAAPILAGVGVAAISMTTGRLLKPVFEKATPDAPGLGFGARAGIGFAEEFPQEGSQGALEQVAQNVAAKIYDENRHMLEGVGEAAVQEGMIGGLTGAAVSSAFGTRPTPPLPPPEEGPDGQLGLPGIGPAQPAPPADEPPAPPEGTYVPDTGMGLQTDIFPDPGTTEAALPPPDVGRTLPGTEDEVMGPTGEQVTLPLGIAGTVPLAERGPGHRTLRPDEIPPTIPDELDQPTAEPQADLQAQIEDMKGAGGRSAVYVSPAQVRTEQLNIPKGAVVIPNFDGKGGRLIAKNQAAADHARARRAEGGSMQAIIGELTLAGVGKPSVKAGHAVQLLDDSGAVARESLVATKAEANKLRTQWKADGEVRILSGEEALARRGEVIEREETREALRTEDPTLVAEATGDLLEAPLQPLTAADTRTTTEGFTVTLLDENNEVIEEEAHETQEEAEARADELAADFPDANVTVAPTRVRPKPTKPGVTTTKSVPKRELKGPTEGPPPRPRSEVSKESTRPVEVSKAKPAIDKFDETVSTKDIEALPEFEVEFSVIEEEVQPNKAIKVVERRETKTYKSRAAAKAAGTRAHKAAVKKAGKDYGVKESTVSAVGTPELEAQFQSAAQARADREQGTTPQKFIDKNKTPSQKVQFIRRERAAQIRRSQETKNLRRTAKPTRVTKAGKPAKTDTSALTYKTKSGDETVAQKAKRLAAVKEATTRLRYALTKARKFLDRFKNLGAFGTYLSNETNLDGSLTKKGIKFAKAREGLFQLIELAEALLISDNTSNAHATLARQIAISLERVKVKGMSPQQFANEFSAVIEALEQDITRLTKESKDTRTKKIAKLNRARTLAIKNQAQLEETWGKDTFFREIVGPIFRKFSEVIMGNTPTAQAPKAAAPPSGAPRYYKPSEFEMTNLRVALRSYRNMSEKYPKADWYTPIREQLEYYGFRFDEAGDLIVEEFSPSDALLAPAFLARTGVSATAAEGIDYTTKKPARTAVPEDMKDAVAVEEEQLAAERKKAAKKKRAAAAVSEERPGEATRLSEEELSEQRVAVKNIRATNALIRTFKEKVLPSKVTINGIKRAEQRLIRGLRKLGVWVDVSPTMGRISIGGYKSKTYRLVGPRLDTRKIQKSAAKDAAARLAPIPMPRELAPVASRMVEVDAAVEQFVDENELDLFLEAVNPVEDNGEYVTGASALGDLIEAGVKVNGNSILAQLAKHVSPDTFYGKVINHLNNFDFGEIKVKYGRDSDGLFGPSDFPNGEYGNFNPKTGTLLLNRSALSETKSDRVFGARVLHTITHELLHAGTYHAVEKSPALKEAMTNLRDIARAAYLRKFPGTPDNKLPYGLKLVKQNGKENPIHEFIAEAFSNPALQAHLKATKFDVKDLSLWQRFAGLVKRVFDIDPTGVTNVWEALLLTEDILFEYAGETGGKNTEELFMQGHDSVLRGFADHFISRFLQSSDILRRVREGGGRTIFNLMSMEQFVERFSNNSVIGENIKRYYDAFRKRNAKAAEYLQIPQKLSHRWSELEASNPEDALAISQVSTEASLLTIDPRVPLTDDANAHLSDELADDHARLHARWNELSLEAKKLTNEVLDYYNESLTTETLFLMQSALRGMLTGREGSALEAGAFEKQFSIAELKKLETRKDLDDALSEFFEEEGRRELLDTIYKMSMLPRKRRGIYVPLMRYGDEVSSAQRQHEDRIFEDRKEAMAARAEVVEDDPTTSASVFENDDGKFVLRVTERIFIMGETVSEVEQMKQQMIDDQNNDFTAEDFSVTQKRVSKNTEEAIGSNAALRSILDTLSGDKAAQQAIKNFYLRNLSEKAHRKHEVRRRNRLGVRFDLQHRNLAAYAKQASYYTAQLEFGWKMAKELRDAREAVKPTKESSGRDASLALKHLSDRDQLSHDLPDRSTFTKKSIEATHFFMLASPSYWAINASQPWMVTLPTIAARHGWMESAAQMWQMQKVIFGELANEAAAMKGGLSALGKGNQARVEETFNVISQIKKKLVRHFGADAAQYNELLEYLRKNHIIDINVFTEMRDVAAGKKQNTWDRTIDASRIMAHLTEVNNRVVTALAAYQLELNKTGDSEAAVEYAGNMVSQTQFNYSAENKPPVFQKYPLLFQFMQWPQHMYAHLIRNYVGMVEAGVMNKSEARSALLGLLGTHAAVGGVTGMMLQPIKWAIGLTMMALGDDDEPYTFANAVSGRTFDRMVAEIADDAFGTTVSSVVTKGLPMAAGIDLSARMSMGTMYFVDLRGDNAESVLGSLVASFGGATLNQGIKFATGVGKIMDGEPYRGIETMSPKIVRDAMRAGRYYNEGLVNNAGDTVIEAGEMGINDIIAQSFGFQPSQVSQHYSAQTAIKDAERHAIGRRGELMRRFRDADSNTERRKLRQEIREFNVGNPQERITASALLKNRRAQRVRERRFQRYGANVSDKKARYYKRYADPYREE